ncbi:MAG: DUF354 domain-containing protein [Nitrososphaera sp.]|jgi:predicted glycosyltransferase
MPTDNLQLRLKKRFFQWQNDITPCLRIWFDILTPKQVLFFQPAIKLLRSSGHQVFVTSRQYWEAVELAKIKKLDLTIIGSHGGADRYSKLRASASRTYELAESVNNFSPERAVNFSSPEGARVAFGLGIKYIGISDSPHAEAVCRLTVPFMSRLLTPWVIPYSSWTVFGIDRKKITRYHALDPAAWIKRTERLEAHPEPKTPDSDNVPAPSRKTILVRLEESKAAYIHDRRLVIDVNMIDKLVDKFSSSAKVIILCRYSDQIEEMKKRFSDRAEVPDQVIDGTRLIQSSDVFIGAGGTMTTEAALLGKPTISIAPHKFYVETYLERIGLSRRASSPAQLLSIVRGFLTSERLRTAQKRRALRILNSMDDPIDKIVEAILA